MKRKSTGAIVGLILICFGIFIAGRSLGLFYFDIFFNGWWTLFIIIPSFIGLANKGKEKRTSNIIGLCVGFFLLLSAQGIMPWNMFGPLMMAAIFVAIGAKLIFSDKNKGTNNGDRSNDGRTQYYQEDIWVDYKETDPQADNSYYENQGFRTQSSYQYSDGQDAGNNSNYMNNHSEDKNESYNNNEGPGRQGNTNNSNTRGDRVACSAVFSGKSLRFDHEEFHGAMFSVVFGGLDLDLRHAVIYNDVTIEAKVLFGGMDILVPDNVRIVDNSNAVLGGVVNKAKKPTRTNEYIPTIFINSTCVFGGIDIK